MTLDINTIGREVFARFINNGFTATGSPIFTTTGTYIINGSALSLRVSGTPRISAIGSATGATTRVELDSTTAIFFPRQSTTALAPAAVLGGMYFDTTLNKLRIGGAGPAWETVTSAA